MTMGYCATCDRLVEIRAREPRRVDKGTPSDLSGQRAWYPVPHTAENDDSGGRECEGSKRTVD